MPKLNQQQVIEEYLKTLEEQAKESSTQLVKEVSFAFMYGYAQSDFKFLLGELLLTQEQLQIIDERYAKGAKQ
jgi:hypothetical protein